MKLTFLIGNGQRNSLEQVSTCDGKFHRCGDDTYTCTHTYTYRHTLIVARQSFMVVHAGNNIWPYMNQTFCASSDTARKILSEDPSQEVLSWTFLISVQHCRTLWSRSDPSTASSNCPAHWPLPSSPLLDWTLLSRVCVEDGVVGGRRGECVSKNRRNDRTGGAKLQLALE